MSHPRTPSGFKINSKPNLQNLNSSKSTPKSVPPDVKKHSNRRRSLLFNNSNSGEEVAPSLKTKENVRLMGRSASLNPFARPRRPRLVDSMVSRNEQVCTKELQQKLQFKDCLIKDLQSQILSLKADLDKAHSFNKQLDSHNKKLAQDLAAAEAKVAAALHSRQQSISEAPAPKFDHIANKLQHLTAKTYPPPPPPPMHLLPKTAPTEKKALSCLSTPLPPPPPPPPMRPTAKASSSPKTPAIVEFYLSLRKQEEKRDILGPGNQYKSTVTSFHNSIVGEIQNRSSHLLAIKADVETKGDFINGLIQKVVALACTDIEDVLKFVDWLDDELSTLEKFFMAVHWMLFKLCLGKDDVKFFLRFYWRRGSKLELQADERAVLKHFNWPERKADAIREAAIEYRGLKQLENEISSFKDDASIPCGMALKRLAALLDKSEQGIGRLIKLRNSVLHSYQDWKIPINWMLDSGIVSKIKQGSLKLAKMYMRRVIMELEVARNSERESNQEALVLQGVHFAYRAHQFAGGLDSETLCAFEEIRQRVPGHLHLGGSPQLLAAVPSS